MTGTDAGFFEISSAGVLTPKSTTSLDFESAKNSYSFTVEATDGTDKDTVAVTLTVTNVDETGAVSFSATTPVVGAALTASLTDPDGNISGTAWQWATSTDGSAPWSDIGTDSASYTPVAGDVGKYLRATASYTDGHGASGRRGRAQRGRGRREQCGHGDPVSDEWMEGGYDPEGNVGRP